MSDLPRRPAGGRAPHARGGEQPSLPAVATGGPPVEEAPEASEGMSGAPLVASPGLSASEEGLRRELDERNDQFLRLAADFENFRRRKAQELADRSRYAPEEAAKALLPVLDNLRRALEHSSVDGDDQQLQDGLRMVLLQFEQALRSVGVEAVETVGARFDPAVHQAIGGDESDEVTEDTVIAELQPGYRLHDRLLRPALVRVAHPRRGGGGSAGLQL